MIKTRETKQLFTDIFAQAKPLLTKKEFPQFETFCQQFTQWLTFEDFRQLTIMDMAGMLVSYWKFIQTRDVDGFKVRVYNPTYETHGWQSPHTVIEIINEDMPFLVDSVRMEVLRHKLAIHSIIHAGGICVERNKERKITNILEWGTQAFEHTCKEAPIHIQIDRKTEETFLADLQARIEQTLQDVWHAVHDWKLMTSKVEDSIECLSDCPPSINQQELQETIDFLRWLNNDNFTFLGCRDYTLVERDGQKALKIEDDSSLGVLRDTSASLIYRSFADFTEEVQELMLSPQALIIAKTNTVSTVHRPVHTDYIGMKRFDSEGNLIGERRFVGLFTSSAYSSSPQTIPFLRLKVENILNSSKLFLRSHARKTLLHILETFPRNDLFQAGEDELKKIVFDIFQIQERNQIRLFIRKDIYDRYLSCLVYIPKFQLTHDVKVAIRDLLEWNLSGVTAEEHTQYGDSVLVRLHFMIRIERDQKIEYDVQSIEKQVVDLIYSWKDATKELLLDYYGEEAGLALFEKYKDGFSAGYQERNSASVAVSDIKHIERISDEQPLVLNLFRPNGGANHQFDFKIYQYDDVAPLSDVMPILENMGMRVVGEHPYFINNINGNKVSINDFHMEVNVDVPLNLNSIKDNFEQSFRLLWQGKAENDSFNNLIVLAQLSWHQVALIRALTKYLQQAGITYSQTYVETTLNQYPQIAKMLVEYFAARFDIALSNAESEKRSKMLETKIKQALKDVATLDEDTILRYYLMLIKATIRTNYFQKDSSGASKHYISFKFLPSKIDILPKPRPEFEIFVYSPSFEGVHLRGAKVARGGLRWSDRREDFRTEVLGLMKAQQVKNSVIIPAGAKGGFFVKSIKKGMTRDQQVEEGIRCYKNFIRGLLDMTDNIIDAKVIPPTDVKRYDEDDPYLVVAADKGTATFSDIANSISAEYDFWLKDAFASGGKDGYDHKKMGITARGAWVSVQRHFRNLGVDTQTTEFTVAGIGDMSGDVFGNGMLLSEFICLQAAFDHRHIFIDPKPNAADGYRERYRLFHLPRSSWADYNAKLISKGGGIFSRQEKSIKLTREMKKMLAVKADQLTPNELIQAILTMPVDLLWNGGIGTYVKASKQSHAEVGDRNNDHVRVNAAALRCKVIGEGGNLGLTQQARIEFASLGGAVYTDFIDNSAGVDCSDKEVNLKILLNRVMTDGDLTLAKRNNMLKDMTDEVAEIVLADNEKQTLAIELAHTQAKRQIDLYGRFIQMLEDKKIIERSLESLPTGEELRLRKEQGKSLTPPEISVLISCSKIILQAKLLETDVPEDEYLSKYLYTEFPRRIAKRYTKELASHPLKREILATQISNELVNEAGAVYIFRMYSETSALYSDIVRAFVAAREIFSVESLWNEIKGLNNQIPASTQYDMMVWSSKLVRRASRWLLRKYHENLDVAQLVAAYQPLVKKLAKLLPAIIEVDTNSSAGRHAAKQLEAGVPKSLVEQLQLFDPMFAGLDIADAAMAGDFELGKLASIYFALGEQLSLTWLREQIRFQKNETHWEGLALAGIFDDIDLIQRKLAVKIIKAGKKSHNAEKTLQQWLDSHSRMVKRWTQLVTRIKNSKSISPVMLFVGLRELNDLAHVK